jgi:hypothetical protein
VGVFGGNTVGRTDGGDYSKVVYRGKNMLIAGGGGGASATAAGGNATIVSFLPVMDYMANSGYAAAGGNGWGTGGSGGTGGGTGVQGTTGVAGGGGYFNGLNGGAGSSYYNANVNDVSITTNLYGGIGGIDSVGGNGIIVLAFSLVPIPCFLKDAPVMTPTGYRAISTLAVGDLVSTPTGTAKIERVKISKMTAEASVNPYIIEKGQYGAVERLLISPNHRVKTGDGMIEASKLGLEQAKMVGSFDYYNLEIQNWSNMIVSGVVVECLTPTRKVTMTIQEFRDAVKEGRINVKAARA